VVLFGLRVMNRRFAQATRFRRGTSLWLGGLAALGILLSHIVAFWIEAPELHDRARLLDETGHSYWGVTSPLAMALFVAAVAPLAIRRSKGRASGESPRDLAVRSAPKLVALQALGFVALEMVERASSGDSALVVLHEHTLVWGLLVQVVMALLGALFIYLLSIVVDRILALAGGPYGADTSTDPLRASVTNENYNVVTVASGGCGLRGPPLQVGS
jgi:hypothetical protein